MDLKSKVFEKLFFAGDTDVSGEELAEALSVSRAAVWKAVKALREEGYTISSVTNRGYRLLLNGDGTDVDERALSLLLGVKVLHIESVTSTNAYALSLETKEPTLVIADSQSTGRGRHGSDFLSPNDGGLYMSYLFFPALPPEKTAALNDYAAKAVAKTVGGEAIEQEIFKNGKKVAGVLTEVIADQDSVKKAVVGMGIYKDGFSSKRATVIAVMSELKKIK